MDTLDRLRAAMGAVKPRRQHAGRRSHKSLKPRPIMTRRALARASGIPPSTIDRIVNNQGRVAYETVLRAWETLARLHPELLDQQQEGTNG